MNDVNLENLVKELKEAGASENQAQDLSLFSKNLSNLYNFNRSNEVKSEFILRKTPSGFSYFSKKLFLSTMLSLFLLLGFASFVNAQSALPGDLLYPLKRLSENVVAAVDPSFKNVILQRRSEEIKALSNSEQNSKLNETIQEYQKDLNASKNLNLENIQQSELNLREAKKASISAENKSDIEKILMQTQERQKQLQDVKGTEISPNGNNNYKIDNTDHGATSNNFYQYNQGIKNTINSTQDNLNGTLNR